jgi:HPr kinase/phosphorylase
LAPMAAPAQSSAQQVFVHATAVAVEHHKGVLLLGPSGSGKSDLALRIIDAGGRLVADDQVILSRIGEKLFANAPPAIAGRIEARGIGILKLEGGKLWRKMPIVLAVELVEPDRLERLPEPATREFLGLNLPLIRLAPFEASAVAKLRLFLATLKRK